MVLILLSGISITAEAAEQTGCTISADLLTAKAGETVTVPIRITGNTGFHNFAVKLDYDRDALVLVSMDTADDESNYLCGELAGTNIAWTDSEGGSYGYLVCASADPITEDGILFAATFRVNEDFSGKASVAPVVCYVRNPAAESQEFEEVAVTTAAGGVKENDAVAGDVDASGEVAYDDVMMIYQAYIEEIRLTDQQMQAADLDGSGSITYDDVMAVYLLYVEG